MKKVGKIIPKKKKTPVVQEIGWDDQLPEEKREKWEEWVKSLPEMERIEVPRTLTPPTMTPVRPVTSFAMPLRPPLGMWNT